MNVMEEEKMKDEQPSQQTVREILQTAFQYGVAVGKLGNTSDEEYKPYAEEAAINAHIVSVLEELKANSSQHLTYPQGIPTQAVRMTDIDAAISRYKQKEEA